MRELEEALNLLRNENLKLKSELSLSKIELQSQDQRFDQLQHQHDMYIEELKIEIHSQLNNEFVKFINLVYFICYKRRQK